jgi:hypothetical protein
MHLFIKSSLKHEKTLVGPLGTLKRQKEGKVGSNLFTKVLNDLLSATRFLKAPVPVFIGPVSIGFFFFMEKIHFSCQGIFQFEF